MPDPRRLTFDTLDEAVAEAERLRAAGYERAGNWDLSQVCGHLAQWILFAVDGPPPVPLPLRPFFWVARRTFAPRQMRKSLESRSMPAGVPTVPATVPPAGGDEAAAVAELRTAVERFQQHSGEYHPSPMFGALPRETWDALQRVHCAHHLGFLVPRG